MIKTDWFKSSLLLPGTSCILRQNICQYSVQNGQQMFISLCHRLWKARAFPIESRNEAYETLSLLFVRDDISQTCICNNAKDLVQSKLHPKLKRTESFETLELFTHWLNAAKNRSEHLRKKVVVSCCGLEHQSACGMTTLNWKPI